MVAITVRDVPPDIHNGLARLAAGSGKSLEQYLRELFAHTVEKPPLEDWIRQVRARVEGSGVQIGAEEIVRSIREDRDDPRR